MAESPVIGIRIPPELLHEIDSLIGNVGKNRTEVMLTLIRLSLALDTRQNSTMILQRINKIEKKLLAC